MGWVIAGLLLGWVVGELPGALGVALLVFAAVKLQAAQARKPLRRSGLERRLELLRSEVCRLKLRLEDTQRRLARLEGSPQSLTVSDAPMADEAVSEEATQPELPAVTATQEALAARPVAKAATVQGTERLSPSQDPAPPQAPAPPRKPRSFGDSKWQGPTRPTAALPGLKPLIASLAGGNAVARAGVLILLIGVAFLLKYAADQGAFPIQLRMATAFLLGLALAALGWRLRHHRPDYAVSLQGGGLALIYLVTLAGFRLYGLLPAPLAVALLLVTVVAQGLLADRQESLPLALLATLGGFAAPLLLSTGPGNPVALFGGYAGLNLGILALSWRHPWGLLNRLGFVFTFAIGTAWGVLRYTPTDRLTSEPFLAFFVLLYLLIPIFFARRALLRGHPERLDPLIVLGLPIAAFGLQSSLVWRLQNGAALTAAGLAALWALTALILRRLRPRVPTLTVIHWAIATGLGTLALPFAFSEATTSAAWALEGAALVYIGLRLHRPGWTVAGGALPLIAGALFLLNPPAVGLGLPGLNVFQLSATLIAIGAFIAARLLARPRPGGAESRLLLLWSLAWWLLPLWADLQPRLPHNSDQAAGAILSVSATGLALVWVGRALAWRDARRAALLALPLLALALSLVISDLSHPLTRALAWAWPVSLALWGLTLRLAEPLEPRLGAALHTGTIGLLAALAATDAAWRLEQRVTTWHPLGLGLGLLAVFALTLAAGRLNRWPVSTYPRAWRLAAPAGLGLCLLIWAAATSLSFAADGRVYWPLLSPIDLTLLATGALIAVFLRTREASPLRAPALHWSLAAALLVTITGLVFRTCHHLLSIPWEPADLFNSIALQAALSLTWAALALPIMTYASRRSWRPMWQGGAALLGLVTLKLLLIDLAGANTLARIVSFVGVGLLLLIIGYLAPIPQTAAA